MLNSYLAVSGCWKRRVKVRILLGEGRRKIQGGGRRELGESSRVESLISQGSRMDRAGDGF